jgi:N-acetylglutamate synthase-like GNAT family acetyltransferase
VPNINICRVDRLGDELFTYSGSGTLFTRERYVVVRRFGIEDYDAADDLIARGVSEGYLAPRVADEIDILLADGFGAFVEGAHLAGIGALRVSACGSAGEVASLYTLTRFAGGGVGSHLVGFAVAEARALGLRYVYACTTFDAVRDFFARQGFALADQDRVPPDKWEGYDPARRERLRCLRLDL